ncbi:hypothetical protein BO71DRAFT_372482 [Aspergillus ellipticus CBS 707.79]|uniref:RmlC-like cupin n=1 Tax=Aspergillus ellipticus CBS 707.79 TaxID=1448320 RepID=A0A319DUQ0_9EURO|nr:hypothetical protein BO71DRAFT_372482 [Aspergillus ellipticus CBS 707.79]
MEIIHSTNHPSIPLTLSHRGPGLSFKHLFKGTPHTPENYLFTLAHQTTFYSPLHRHNFDQFRFAYRGAVSLAPDILLREGELSYHPEGVAYGPQHDTEGERDVLVLQFGGASGQGYLGFEELEEAQERLKKKGGFVDGKFVENGDAENEEGGKKKKKKDGYEALWEEMAGRRLEYPAPRYGAAVVVKPEGFRWKKVGGQGEGEGAWRKLLGVFTERETVADLWRVDAGGRVEVRGCDAVQLFFVLRGQGEAGGERVEMESAVRLVPGTGVVLTSAVGMEVIRFVLPMMG